PAGIKNPGRDSDALVGQTDILATLAEIVGADLPDHAAEDSQSFAAILGDPKAKHARVPLINHGSNGRFAVTEGHWKLIMAHGEHRKELYDLAVDPREEKNVIAENPEIEEALEQKISEIVLRGRSTPGSRQSNDTGYWKDLTWLSVDDFPAE
ncbi:MAG: sulfatase/phosphatase domain-containing protein, partial [Verrucomicrobiota bacterium]